MSPDPHEQFEFATLDSRHQRGSFDCGVEALNRFLRQYAWQNQQVGASVTHVLTWVDQVEVLGYYCLSASYLDTQIVPVTQRKELPRYPLPTIHLGRLALSVKVRGLGLGELLLLNAVSIAVEISEEVGVCGVDLRAKSEAVSDFYSRFGFTPLLDDRLHMCLMLRSFRQLQM